MTQITPTPNDNNDSPLVTLMKAISPRVARAIETVTNGVLPREHIKKHEGKGGKMFSFVPHTIATKTMNDAFSQLWDFEVLKHEVFPDESAVAYGKLTIHFYNEDRDLMHTRVIQEVGAREPIYKGMPAAYVVLGAASRSLLRCMLRAFNYGMELYENEEPEVTADQALLMLMKYADTCKVPKDEIENWKSYLKENGISKENVVDRFEEAYNLTYQFSQNLKNLQFIRQKEEEEKQAKAIAEEKAKELEAAKQAAKSPAQE